MKTNKMSIVQFLENIQVIFKSLLIFSILYAKPSEPEVRRAGQ